MEGMRGEGEGDAHGESTEKYDPLSCYFDASLAKRAARVSYVSAARLRAEKTRVCARASSARRSLARTSNGDSLVAKVA